MNLKKLADTTGTINNERRPVMDLKKLADTTGTIFDIQYFCIHDGPGIRSTVFMKGCQFNCLWCHNPEGITRERQLSFIQSKCALCGECAVICPEAHVIGDDGHIIHRDMLTDEMLDASACACITKALTVVGKKITAGEVIEQVLRDRRYYNESGGGVTFSGGEPTLQKAFLSASLELAASEGLHTALETNGHCEYSFYDSILPFVDLFLYDYKETDPALHLDFTKADNILVTDNIRKLHDAGAKVLLRCPVIPGLNDRDDHFEAIARLTIEYPNLLGAEILPYHKLAVAKAGRLGSVRRQEYAQPEAVLTDLWREKVRTYGGKVVEM